MDGPAARASWRKQWIWSRVQNHAELSNPHHSRGCARVPQMRGGKGFGTTTRMSRDAPALTDKSSGSGWRTREYLSLRRTRYRLCSELRAGTRHFAPARSWSVMPRMAHPRHYSGCSAASRTGNAFACDCSNASRPRPNGIDGACMGPGSIGSGDLVLLSRDSSACRRLLQVFQAVRLNEAPGGMQQRATMKARR